MKTLMKKLIAAKSHRYGTRQMQAGDEYEASRMHSRILVGARLARYAEEQPERPPVLARAKEQEAAPQPVSPQRAGGTEANDDELAVLRHKAASLGVPVDQRWGVNRLNREILQRETRR